MNRITAYWKAHAKYDLETAKAMLKSRRYLYVAFMCQQAIEKLLKAIITKRSGATPPRTHDLVRLSKEAGVIDAFSPRQLEFCAALTPFCIETRYAEERERLAKLTDAALAKDILRKTKELFTWLSGRIK